MTAGLGWNPLLGIPPTSIYERLVDAPGPKHLRWPFHHSGDSLVHSLLGLYRTKHWEVGAGFYVPVEAITECGVLALMRPAQVKGAPPVYDSGRIVPTYHLSCLRCASGIDGEGVRFRDVQKETAFAQIYGRTGMTMAGTATGRMSSKWLNISNPPRRAKP